MTLALVGGIIFLVLGSYAVHRDRQLTRTGQRVTGTVADLWARSDGDGGRTYRYLLAFQTLDGQPVQAETGGSSRIIAQPGEQVPVIYDPRNPTRAHIDTRAGHGSRMLYIFPVAGVGLIIFAIVHLVR